MESTEFEVLVNAIVSVLSVYPKEISETTTFAGDLGADSLDAYQIVLNVEEELGLTFNPEEIRQISTVGDALEMIKKAEETNGN
ncbi:MAG: acyl carrier protein [Lachnospiraceae bacterium]|nr:acyl carrier protein [Lachnospiraceae bacterium]